MSAYRIKVDLVRIHRHFNWTRNCTIPEAVLTSGLAAIAGMDAFRGAAGSIAIWLLRMVQQKEADGVGQHSRCERCARACFGNAPGRSTWIGCTMSISLVSVAKRI